MAYITDHTHSIGTTVGSAVNTFVKSLSTFLSDLTHAYSRADFIQELQGLDDETLKAKHGITRAQIVGYVFRDKLLP